MPPSFISRLRERELPPEPPAQNPFVEASTKWDELRRFATEVLALARETDERNMALSMEIESMRRENKRLTESQARLERDNRLIRAYSHSLRTRLTAVREALEIAEREALHHASEEGSERSETKEREATARVAEGIVRINPNSSAGAAVGMRHPTSLPAVGSLPPNAL